MSYVGTWHLLGAIFPISNLQLGVFGFWLLQMILLPEVQSGRKTHPVTELPRILMKAGAYSDSLTAANGDPLKDLKEILYGSATCDFPQNSFEHHFLRFGLQRQFVDPFALCYQKTQFSTHWFVIFVGGDSWTYMDIWMHLQICRCDSFIIRASRGLHLTEEIWRSPVEVGSSPHGPSQVVIAGVLPINSTTMISKSA